MNLTRREAVTGACALPLAAAVPQDAPAAVARVAPDRFDDLMWENDRVAYRIYGAALEAKEPPSGSGIDVWAKRVRRPFMDRQLASGRYHEDQGEGLDFYDVGRSRGAGGLGVWYDNKLWTSRNYRNPRIAESGGDVARFSVDYAPWPVDVIRNVSETRSIELRTGSSFMNLTSRIRSNTPDPLIIGLGICKQRNAQGSGRVVKGPGLLTFHEPDDPAHGALSLTIIAPTALAIGHAEDAENHLLLIQITPDQPFTYQVGSAWNRGLDFQSAEAWDTYVSGRR
ncbi:DUF4861 family protein [Brevundimonas sp. NPDC092305]|uniref:DUF4861 family protein n=1 Tax=Brevundimonas sp. NPDC092305 TaxID=3363957 RepID=UPI003800DFDA